MVRPRIDAHGPIADKYNPVRNPMTVEIFHRRGWNVSVASRSRICSRVHTLPDEPNS
jgi:hypothetical protein